MIYILAGVAALFGIMSIVIFFYKKRSEILSAKVDKERTAKEQSNAVIMQKVKAEGAVKEVITRLRDKRKEDQIKIDSGDRSGFDNDEY
jgi:Na+-transporting methylmalonyl-CoA/oxaloacetate decarboxylase gamma subunit